MLVLLGCLLAPSVLPRRRWQAVRGFALATATFLMATTGVVAGPSVDEGVGLLPVVVLSASVAPVAGAPGRTPGDGRPNQP